MARRQIQLDWKMKSEAPGSSLKLSSHTLSSEKPSPISIRLAEAPYSSCHGPWAALSHHLAHNIHVCVIHVWHIMCVQSWMNNTANSVSLLLLVSSIHRWMDKGYIYIHTYICIYPFIQGYIDIYTHTHTHTRTKWSEVKEAQPCPTLCDLVDCSLPDSFVHGILQARILEWVAVPFSRGSSQPRDRTQVSRVTGGFFTVYIHTMDYNSVMTKYEILPFATTRMDLRVLH